MAAVFAALLCAAPFGCGAGQLQLISLNLGSIDPPSPRPTEIPLDRCYWWVDEQERVWIAMQRESRPPLLPQARFAFEMSLCLERLPAGPARNYQVRTTELRAVARVGPVEARLTSRRGIVALYREGADRLRGSLRLEALRRVAQLLGGWGAPTRLLLHGSFVATRDEARGRAIARRTESQGFDRGVVSEEAAQVEKPPRGAVTERAAHP
jgi:hypothetical protein